MNKKLTLELKQPEFDRSRLRVYYGNIGEIIAQELLRRQGFEVVLTRPVANEKDYFRIDLVQKMDESIEELNKGYEKEFLNYHKEYIEKEITREKSTRAFFGEQLNAFKQYLKKLKIQVVGERLYKPDLIAKRDGKIYVVEVKSTKGALKFLKGKWLNGFLLAKEYGFIPALVSFNLKIEADNFKMEEISE